MANSVKPRFFLGRLSWWGTLFVGAAIGITSQRIPEIKIETDKYLAPLETTTFIQGIRKEIAKLVSENGGLTAQLPSSHYIVEQAPTGTPTSSFIINRTGYSLAYDARTRNPIWVYEHLTEENLHGDTDGNFFAFREDDTIPSHLKATAADYKGQGLDQGLMAPPANHAATPEEMRETFFLTNACPQCPQLNRDYWEKLEKHTRELTKKYPHVYVITGPLYQPYQEGKRRFVKYQVIGPNEVAVPTHFFKVIVLEDEQSNKKVHAYILPNTVIPSDTPLDNFRTTIQKVEKTAGLLLFNQ